MPRFKLASLQRAAVGGGAFCARRGCERSEVAPVFIATDKAEGLMAILARSSIFPLGARRAGRRSGSFADAWQTYWRNVRRFCFQAVSAKIANATISSLSS